MLVKSQSNRNSQSFLRNNSLAVSSKVKHLSSHSIQYYHTISLLAVPHKSLHINFITVKTRKKPRYSPSVGEWINRYIQIMEYYLALKRNGLSIYKKTWSYLKCILLSERNQSEMVKYVTSWMGKTIDTILDQWFPGTKGKEVRINW